MTELKMELKQTEEWSLAKDLADNFYSRNPHFRTKDCLARDIKELLRLYGIHQKKMILEELNQCKFQTDHSGYTVPYSSIEKVLSLPSLTINEDEV